MPKRKTRNADSPARRLLFRAGLTVGALAIAAFLIEGGEWGTVDLLRQRGRFDRLKAEVRQLEQDVDSLRAEYHMLTTDAVRLERVAREQYGMVRGNRELLYWVRDADVADSAGARPPR